MNRRHVLALLGTTTLTGCGLASQVVAPIVNNVIPTVTIAASVLNDAALIAKGLATALSVLTGFSFFATIENDINDIQNAVALMSTVMTVPDAQSKVSIIETAVNDILEVAASLPLPPPFGLAIQAAAALVPILEGAVGLIISTSDRMSLARIQAPMTPDEARFAFHQIIGN